MNRSYRDILFACLVIGALYLPIVLAVLGAGAVGAVIAWALGVWLD